MEQLLENWTDYLLERMGARPTVRPQLPIIPLGVDCDAFLKGEEAARARHQLRQQYGIGAEDLVVLFVGRLIFHAKAHPVPMYLAVERAAQATAKKVHLIQAGWFEDTQQETAFKEGAASFCPGVNPIFVDGRQPDLRDKIWAIADVFVSLADNIQETFGLTPIEAMAAGLPVIVSDWNGYQDTVRPDVDGFRIATTLPPARCGLDFALNYYSDRLNYSTYVGHISLMTAVDVDACTQALITLFQHPELRQQMGTQGRQRARDGFDWQVVIRAYEALWQDLNERRTAHSPVPPTTIPFHPLCDDPCQLLAHYPTQQLLPTHRLTLGAMADPASLQRLRSTWMTNFGADRRLAGGVIDRLLAAIAAAGSLAVADILQHYSDPSLLSQIYLYRTLVYLMKFDILRLLPDLSQTGE